MLTRGLPWARVLWLASALPLVPACSLPRSVTGGAPGHDAGNGTLDVGGIDAATLRDAGLDGGALPDVGPRNDAFVGNDAFVATDAFVGNDAFVATDAGMDAFVPPDMGTDAFVPPDMGTDAWTAPRSCDAIFGVAQDYQRCSESMTECQFFLTANGASCNAVCASYGASCTGAVNNGLLGNCSWGGNLSCSTTGYTDYICTCTHIP